MLTLPAQLFRGSRPRPELVKPAGRGHSFKPAGGMWTSSYVDGGSDWERWLREDASEVMGAKLTRSRRWLLTPEPARVYALQEASDVYRLFESYGVAILPDYEPRSLDEWPAEFHADIASRRLVDFKTLRWEEFAEEWDALWLLSPWLEMDGGLPLNHSSILFYGWDCESTWWARWSFSAVSEL